MKFRRTVSASSPTPALLALAGSTLLPGFASASPLPLTVVSYSGQAAPGQPAGVTFAFFDQTRLSKNPSTGLPILTFWAELAGPGITAANNQTIYSDRSGAMAPIYATGATAPWYTFTTFNAFPQIAAGIDGSVSILGIVSDTGLPPNSSLEAKNGGVFTESSPGTLVALAREGEPLPIDPLVNWNNMSLPHVADTGALSFWAGTPSIVWSGGDGVSDAIVVPGMIFPGLDATETIDTVAPQTQGSGGDVVFHAQIVEDNPRLPTGTGLWILRTGGPAILARSGGVASPGELSYTRPASRAAINARGDAAFHSMVENEPSVPLHALILDIAGSQTLLAVQGEPCPALAGDVTYGALSTLPAINSCGSVAFHATLSGTSTDASNNAAVFRRDSEGTLEAVLREGDSIADLPGYVVTSLGDPILLDSGALVVMAHAVNATIANSEREALLAVTDTGDVRLIAAVGNSIEVAPGDARQIESILWSTDPAGSGRAQATSDGHLSLVLHFAGNTHALVTGYLPPIDDVNVDGLVDILDFLDFIDAFSTCELQPAPCPDSTFNVDLDASGTVDILDFLLFIDAFGGEC